MDSHVVMAMINAQAGATCRVTLRNEGLAAGRYEAPRSVVVVDSIGPSPAGKVDYKGVKARALAAVGSA